MENVIEALAGEATPSSYADAAGMALEHLGNLFGFMDARLGELVMFDPEARVKEATIREAIKVGRLVCERMVADAPGAGVDPQKMRDLWDVLVEATIRGTEPGAA